MDFPAFASLAQVRILLVPVGSIQRETFDKWAAEIRTFENLRLGDIPADNRDDRVRFMPNPLSKGHLHLSFPSHPPSPAHHPLALFRPSSFPLGVIGIASCSQADSLASILAEFNAAVNEMFPVNSPFRPIFPLANNCFVFEEGDSNTNLNLGEQLSGLVVIPSMMGNKKLYIGTILADMCSNILAAFSILVSTLESPVGNEYLNATLFPLVPSITELPASLNDSSSLKNSLPHLSSHHSQPEIGTLATLRSTSGVQRPSSTGPTSPRATSRQSTLGPPGAKNLKRQTMIGAASSHGRLFKTLGDFFLLAGRTEDALVWYTEAIAVCRVSNDTIWLASAIEGSAVVAVVDAWTSGYGLNSSFSNSRGPWADIAEKLIQVSALYAKSPSTVDPTDGYYPLLAHLYTSSVLRHATLLFAAWSAKGWGPLAFTTMLQPGPKPVLPPTLSGPASLSENNLERLTMITNISRAQISAVIAEAHGPWLLHLGVRERIIILENIAGLYACLGYKRKEAYVLREVLGCIMDLVVIGRDDTGERRSISSPSSGAGMGIQTTETNGSGSLGVRYNERTEGNESILRIVKYVCSVHGIDMEAVKLVTLGSSPTEVDRENATVSTEEVPSEPFGWPELQVGIVREALAIAEALPDYPHVAQFCLSALKVLYPVLTAADQSHLYVTASRALATSRRRGDRRVVDYWSAQPITSIAVTPLPFVRLPLEKPISALSIRTSNPIMPRATDPFLYNPRRAVTAQGQTTVVQNENVEVVVTLNNPFVFELELQSLSLSTAGVPFEHKTISVIVPSNTYHPVTITGKALEPGVLTIRGCIVQALGGAPREFVLPLATEEEDEKQSRRRSAMQCEFERHKHGGLDSRPWNTSKRFSQASSATNQRVVKFLECSVIPEQPLLRIRRSSLTHGAVMLYNGETSTIRITIENVSTLPIDFVKLSFDDNTIAPAQQALADGELSVFDTYETEYELIQKPTFSWDGQSVEILPGEETALNITCQGKVGCASGSIQISYSHTHRRQNTLQQPRDVFHTRHLSYPVLVTVYHMLECHDMDIMDWSSLGVRWNSISGQDDLNMARRLLAEVDEHVGWCVFAIDVRNTYGLPFEVAFDCVQHDAPTSTYKTVVAPGSTTRVLVPLRKFLLSEEHTAQPIPTLSDRQFVVDKSSMTSTELNAQRELFWYREELFKCIKGRWKELGGIRSGELSLRRQRMTLPMLEALRTETVRLQFSVTDDQGSIVEAHAPCRYRLSREAFYLVHISVKNLSPQALTLTMSVIAEPVDHVIHEGTLSDIPVGRLLSGQSADTEFSVSFAVRGTFELEVDTRVWGAVGEGSKVGRSILKADVQ